ncbi:hypothetical protein PFISCL1PPCAC_2333 [Pristionchus fissidentatus]|uniref:ShKT domain-containing protein n=1 Tax=Pristionchus fissidentatus TaxID=1538716 RepID=A0AAV5UVB3_9BILA|nr:hypothetical protein PFISCL1PPCAC_2333 [Pristionchus fissidentatus]
MILLYFTILASGYAQFELPNENDCDTNQECDIAILVCPYGYTCSAIDEINGIGFCCRNPQMPVLPPYPPHPTPPSTECKDLSIPGGISECTAKSYLCKNAVYNEVMRVQCPKTCGLCNGDSKISQPGKPFTVINDMFPFWRGSSGLASTQGKEEDCYDKTIRGRLSDCPARAHLCQSEAHIAIMHRLCPKTCKLC